MIPYKDINLADLKKSSELWIASVGTMGYIACKCDWINLLIPTKMRILDLDVVSTSYEYNEYCQVTFNLDGWELPLEYKVSENGLLEKKYQQIIGLDEMDITECWLEHLRLLLKDTWSGINNNNSNLILKQYLYKNAYEYFNTRYPELLI